MALVRDLMAFGMPPKLASLLGDTVVSSLAAVGLTQTGAALLNGTQVIVTTSTATNNSVILPSDAQLAASAYGPTVQVWNNGTTQLQVFPPVGAAIDNGGTNLPYVIDVGSVGVFSRVSATVWISQAGGGTAATALTAAGTNAATALVLAGLISQVGTVASGTGVILPKYMGIGAFAFVTNGAATNALLVYPPNGATFYNAGASISVAAGLSVLVVRFSATLCGTILSA